MVELVRWRLLLLMLLLLLLLQLLLLLLLLLLRLILWLLLQLLGVNVGLRVSDVTAAVVAAGLQNLNLLTFWAEDWLKYLYEFVLKRGKIYLKVILYEALVHRSVHGNLQHRLVDCFHKIGTDEGHCAF